MLLRTIVIVSERKNFGFHFFNHFSHWRLGGTRERDPRYQKLRVRGIRIRNTRRGQPARCAMGKSRPGGTASLITVNLDAK